MSRVLEAVFWGWCVGHDAFETTPNGVYAALPQACGMGSGGVNANSNHRLFETFNQRMIMFDE